MAYRYSSSGQEWDRPNAENGIHYEGPLSAEDLRTIIGDLLEALSEQVERETKANFCTVE